MADTIYVKMRHRIQVKPNHMIRLKDIAQLLGKEDTLVKRLNEKVIYHVNMSDKNIVVIDVMQVMQFLLKAEPGLDIQTVGPSQAIIQVDYGRKKTLPLYIAAVCFLLFVGAALAIMNFHEDVSMQEVHQKIYTLITGKESEQPLLFQIPYSIGLGAGMILFFNHLFQKRINEEPSPLEVEMFNYQQDLDQYVIMNENRESLKPVDSD
ncbi:stage V sporulation protein AA [Bacillus marinisedimentorum]|uniref:stage V sporulation protein AA n=1 Tax=Bacillus marinisedimentorum TaxID=1821260 RepID=UPI0008726A31|nr:stage V sporulation protein AA [Bacillus marinisedimentorum]